MASSDATASGLRMGIGKGRGYKNGCTGVVQAKSCKRLTTTCCRCGFAWRSYAASHEAEYRGLTTIKCCISSYFNLTDS